MNIKYITKDLKDIRFTPDIEASVEKKITQRLRKYSQIQDGVISVRISEKKPFARVDIEMPYMNYRIHAESESSDGILTCIDKCMDIIERQIAKYKTRIHRSRVKSGELKKEYLDIVNDNELISPAPDEIVVSETDDGNETEYKVIKVENYQLKPMNVEEAVLQMEVLDYKFLFFFDTETETPAIVYKRDDGNIGLIES
ncbi:MAG: ribosome-associated translation inhibitor RaiA [Oscillospiraceae bacterium]|nr:ribosome-associated translation inhibitor RaiA [Oscillospiraceae bacterium]